MSGIRVLQVSAIKEAMTERPINPMETVMGEDQLPIIPHDSCHRGHMKRCVIRQKSMFSGNSGCLSDDKTLLIENACGKNCNELCMPPVQYRFLRFVLTTVLMVVPNIADSNLPATLSPAVEIRREDRSKPQASTGYRQRPTTDRPSRSLRRVEGSELQLPKISFDDEPPL